MSSWRIFSVSLLACLCVLACGCSLSVEKARSVVPDVLPAISGTVHGGEQPISGATIQLYSVNSTTVAGASTPMLSSAVTTGSDGSFSITGLYTCPVSNPWVYLVSTGGNPGLGGSVNNSDIVLMAALGTCNSLTATTYVVINELTTVAAVEQLAPFMTDATHIGTSSTNLASIGQAFQTASIVNLGTGTFSAPSVSLFEAQYTTLANILAACVNTAGGSSGDGSVCGNLMLFAGSGSTDTTTAALQMVRSPTNNATQLYGLITATPPFQPYFTSVPTDLTVTLGVPLPPNVRTAALDSNGHFWLYTGGYSYDTVADTSTDLQGVVTVYDNNFGVLFTIPTGNPGAGGLYYPFSAAVDKSGDVFFVNANNTITEFNSSGTAISPAGGWSTGVTATFTGTGPGNGYVVNSTQVDSIRVDYQGNIWGVTPSGASNCYVELNSSGTVITPVGTFCAMAGGVSEIATNGSGSAWTSGAATISKVTAGAQVATAPSSPSCFYPQNVAQTANPTGYIYVETNTVEYDHIHNQLWGYSDTGAGAITDGGTALFCDAGSSTLPVIPPFGPVITAPTGSPYVGGSLLIQSGTLDGAGNFWYVTSGIAENGVVGSTPGRFSGTATFSTYLNGISPSGTLLTTYNPVTKAYGLQPSGVGANATATATDAFVSNFPFGVGLLGVDLNANIWVYDFLSNRIIKIPSLATANTLNY